MELLSIGSARFVGLVSTAELNPRGLSIYPSLIDGLIEKYSFAVFPADDEVLDETKGVIFEDGAWGKIGIDKVSIYSDGILVDTRSSTADSEAIFHEALEWAATSFGLTYKREMILRRRYISEVTFRSDVELATLNPKLKDFGDKVSVSLGHFTELKTKYEVTSVGFHYDTSDVKVGVPPFKFERLETCNYAENKYYSIAPLPTEEHLRLLAELETTIASSYE